MKQQCMVLVVLAVIVVAAVVWQQTAVAPEVHEDVRTIDIATTTRSSSSLPAVVGSEVEPVLPVAVPDEALVACTMDAKQCPDGSSVGRTGPDCAFAACPSDSSETPKTVTCTPDMSSALVCPEMYAPVCGLVQIQCVTTPCNPIPETFSNGCSACAQGNVISYTAGVCS
jgi:hypothetical protein